jgi:hypothetical protein
MARPRVAGGVDGLQLWRIASNTLKSSRGQLKRCDSSAWRLGERITAPHLKKQFVTDYYTKLRIWRVLVVYKNTPNPKPCVMNIQVHKRRRIF